MDNLAEQIAATLAQGVDCEDCGAEATDSRNSSTNGVLAAIYARRYGAPPPAPEDS